MDFEQLKLKKFGLWDLFLHQQQFPYIGRCYAWANKPESETLIDITRPEREELFGIIIPQVNLALQNLFHPETLNLAIFGNTSRHLHAHLIPRYAAPRIFKGVEFIDPNPSGNYAPYPKKQLPIEIMSAIRDEMAQKLK